MFEFIVRAQVVATCVRGTTERTLKPAGEVDVVVVPDVRHDLAAQLAPVKVAAAWHPVKGQPHVPGFWTCNINTRQVTFNCWPPNTTYTTTSRPRPTLCRRRLDRFSLSLSLFLSSHVYSLSLVLSVSVSPSSPFASSTSLSPSPHPSSPPPLSSFLPYSSPLPLFYLFFFFFFFITSPLIFPSFTLLLTNQGRDRATRIYIYTRFLFPCLSHRREVFLHASLFKVTTFLLHPREARSFTRHPFSKCRAAVWRARERIEGRWWIDRCIPAGLRTSFFFFFFFEIRKREMYISRTEERKRDTNFFSPLMKIGWEFKRARVDQEKKKIRFA